MKFSTFYFTGTGNTKWAAEEFNNIVIEKGHGGELFSIESPKIQDTSYIKSILESSDYIGFANPIYGANIPPIMRGFILKVIGLSSGKGKYSKPVYIINTFGYVNAFGPAAAGKLFRNTGLHLISHVNIRMCNNILTPKMNPKLTGIHSLNARKERAKERLDKMVVRLLSGRKYITGIGPYLIPGIFIRKKSKKAIENHYKTLSVNTETCSRCMHCVKNCPTYSIEYTDNEYIFHPGCTACMRCYNFCPTGSILMDGVFADPNIYKRYHGPKS